MVEDFLKYSNYLCIVNSFLKMCELFKYLRKRLSVSYTYFYKLIQIIKQVSFHSSYKRLVVLYTNLQSI